MEIIDIDQIPKVKKFLEGKHEPINSIELINLTYNWAKENNKQIEQFVYVPTGFSGSYKVVYTTKPKES